MASFVVSRVSMEVCIIKSLLYREASISRATLVPRLDCHVNSLNTTASSTTSPLPSHPPEESLRNFALPSSPPPPTPQTPPTPTGRPRKTHTTRLYDIRTVAERYKPNRRPSRCETHTRAQDLSTPQPWTSFGNVCPRRKTCPPSRA